MNIDTTFLRRCIGALEYAFNEISEQGKAKDFVHEIYRAACVKEFELVLEQSGNLLRKHLASYFSSNHKPTASTSRTCSGVRRVMT